MLTKSDKKFILDSIKNILSENNKVIKKNIDDSILLNNKVIKKNIDDSIAQNNEVVIKDILDLFNITNKIIEETEEKLSAKIDIEIDELKNHSNTLNNHEIRLDHLEHKVYTTTTSP